MEPQTGQEATRRTGSEETPRVSPEERARAQEEWRRYNERLAAQGRELTERQKRFQEELIRQGKSPKEIRELLSTEKGEEINSAANKERLLIQLLHDAKDYIDAQRFDETQVAGAENFITRWVDSGIISQEQAENLIEGIKEHAAHLGSIEEDLHDADPIEFNKAKKALQKYQRLGGWDSLSSEDRELLLKYQEQLGI